MDSSLDRDVLVEQRGSFSNYMILQHYRGGRYAGSDVYPATPDAIAARFQAQFPGQFIRHPGGDWLVYVDTFGGDVIRDAEAFYDLLIKLCFVEWINEPGFCTHEVLFRTILDRTPVGTVSVPLSPWVTDYSKN